jgi:hypothetical protein
MRIRRQMHRLVGKLTAAMTAAVTPGSVPLGPAPGSRQGVSLAAARQVAVTPVTECKSAGCGYHSCM